MNRITVMDAQGNTYQSTYPKRAKGLVKKGRARFVEAHTICLTCPPDMREELPMTEQNEKKMPMNLTAAQIFAELQQIRQDTAHIALALEKLEKVPTGYAAETAVCQEKIAAIENVVTAREETNQALIRLYEKMYDDIYETADAETL